jgi:hypothetical protein
LAPSNDRGLIMAEHAVELRDVIGTGATVLAGFAAWAVAAKAVAVSPEPTLEAKPLITRIWHGRTPAAKAEEYTA